MSDLNPIKCLVVDDEPPARAVLTRYIQQVPVLMLEAEANNAMQAWALMQQVKIDLVFLDIHMPQLSGIDFLRTLKNPPKIIFTTAFSEYALQGYELDVVDYLLKPIPLDRFLKAVNKVIETRPGRAEQPLMPDEKPDASFVYFRADRKMVKVLLSDIRYVESMKDYVKVYTRQGLIITKQSISSVEAMLPEKAFFRVHRSYIVSLQHIKNYTSELIGLGDTEIPIGKLYRLETLRQLEI